MTPLLIFAGAAALLVVVVLVMLLRAFRRRAADPEQSRAQLNVAVYRDELAELEHELAEGLLAAGDYERSRVELQRRMLEDCEVASADVKPAETTAEKTTVRVVAVVVPVLAVLLYVALGTPAALNPPPPGEQVTPAEVEQMVAGLAAKLEKEPGNLQGWAMLGRSYKVMGRFPEAVRAFERAGSFMDGDPALLLSYADALASRDRGFSPAVDALVDKALALDPGNLQGLWMKGTSAFNGKRYAQAVADWEKLLALVEPGSENAGVISANIEEARRKGGLAAGAAAAPAADASANAFIKGRVELAPALTGKLPDDAVLMVVVRPTDGSRMPVAVLRIPAAKLPLSFTLDDSLSMTQTRRLSQFPEVLVEARISASGGAVPQPGDLFGAAQAVKLGAAGVVLKVDQVRP